MPVNPQNTQAYSAIDGGGFVPSNANIGNFVDGAGDAVYFDAFQGSGNLNNLKGDKPTELVYPEDLRNNPKVGNVVHFDIFFKKPAKMNDVTERVRSLSGVNTLKEVLREQKEDISEDKGFFESLSDIFDDLGSSDEPTNILLDGIRDFVDSGGGGDEFKSDSISEDTRLGKAVEASSDKVSLYMPNGLRNSDNIAYSEQDFGLLKGLLEANLATLIPGVSQQAAAFADSLAEITGFQLNSEAGLSAITGAVRNPRKEQLFSEVNFRVFEFKFDFYPKSKKESHDVMEIIKLFRFHAYPEVVPNKAFYNLPSEFQITYVDLNYPSNNPFQVVGQKLGQQSAGFEATENQWLNKIGRCVLTNVDVDYSPAERNTFFADGAPSIITMNLTFAELESMSRNKVKLGY
jgi:hypothetical protein